MNIVDSSTSVDKLGFPVVCQMCLRSIQYPIDHLRHYHRIDQEGALAKILNSKDFFLNDVDDLKPILPISKPKQKNIRHKEFKNKSGANIRCLRFSCKYCAFCHRMESVLDKHFRKKHREKVLESKEKSHWTRQSMRVSLNTRIDQLTPSNCFDNRLNLPREPIVKLKIEKVKAGYEEALYYPFPPGELILSRIRGFPWWPAMVSKTPNNQEAQYEVLFFDVNKTTKAMVSGSQMKLYEDFEPYLRKMKSQLSKAKFGRMKEASSWADMTKPWTRKERFDYFVHGNYPDDQKQVKAEQQQQQQQQKQQQHTLGFDKISRDDETMSENSETFELIFNDIVDDVMG